MEEASKPLLELLLIAVIATCKVCRGTIEYEKPNLWESEKALGMSVINDLVEETACFDNSFEKLSNGVEKRDRF